MAETALRRRQSPFDPDGPAGDFRGERGGEGGGAGDGVATRFGTLEDLVNAETDLLEEIKLPDAFALTFHDQLPEKSTLLEACIACTSAERQKGVGCLI